jgi:hypothetical protein
MSDRADKCCSGVTNPVIPGMYRCRNEPPDVETDKTEGMA